MIENEVVFRHHNERVQKNFQEIKQLAREANQEYLVRDDDTALHFYCECSDENCRQRVQMKPTVYTKIHKRRNCFVLISGHDVKRIERVIQKEKHYWVVEKFVKLPETVRELQPTNVDNT